MRTSISLVVPSSASLPMRPPGPYPMRPLLNFFNIAHQYARYSHHGPKIQNFVSCSKNALDVGTTRAKISMGLRSRQVYTQRGPEPCGRQPGKHRQIAFRICSMVDSPVCPFVFERPSLMHNLWRCLPWLLIESIAACSGGEADMDYGCFEVWLKSIWSLIAEQYGLGFVG